MNWRRGILLAAINLAVALPPTIWLESKEAAFVREHKHYAAESSTAASSETPGALAEAFVIDPCSLVDAYPAKLTVVGLANIPAGALTGWRNFCPARWSVSGMLHAGGWPPTASSVTANRKADVAFLVMIALQWVLVGALPLGHPKRSWSEPGMFITICAALSVAVVFIPPLEDIAKIFALFATCAWIWWFGLLVWKFARSAWKWTARRVAADPI